MLTNSKATFDSACDVGLLSKKKSFTQKNAPNDIKYKNTNSEVVKLYKKRWLILLMYIAYTMCNTIQWMQYSIISSIVEQYYNVSEWQVELTTLTTMLCYVPFAFPVSFLMERIDLRKSAIIGICGTAIGSWIKLGSVSPEKFYITFIGQTFIACSSIFMMSVPPKLASLWFGHSEVSTVCSIGLFGNQFGMALGFYITPLMVHQHDDLALIGRDLFTLFLSIACISTILFLVIVFFFQAEPPLPPSRARALQINSPSKKKKDYLIAVKNLFNDSNLVMYFLCCGVNNGSFNAVSTLLNNIFVNYFPAMEESVGQVGATIIVAGMAASIVFGILLDKTKRFKEIITTVYLMSGASVLLFLHALRSLSMLYVYIAATVLGIFLSGFTAVSFDVATEITYPESEVIVGTIMNMMSLGFCILITIVIGITNDYFGCFWGCSTNAAILFAGGIWMSCIKVQYKRQKVQDSSLELTLA